MRRPARLVRAHLAVLLLVGAGLLGGCSRQREVAFDLRWDLTDTGACVGPGEGAGEKEITFRYVKAPDHFEKVCSDKIASHLLANGKNPVSALFLYTPSTRGRSLCEVDGIIKATRVGGASGQSCTELGHRIGGTQTAGSARVSPSPFETP